MIYCCACNCSFTFCRRIDVPLSILYMSLKKYEHDNSLKWVLIIMIDLTVSSWKRFVISLLLNSLERKSFPLKYLGSPIIKQSLNNKRCKTLKHKKKKQPQQQNKTKQKHRFDKDYLSVIKPLIHHRLKVFMEGTIT